VDAAALARLASVDVAGDLARIHLRQAGDVVSTFVAGTLSLRRLAGPGPLHTDDNGLLEYAAPRTLHRSMSAENLEMLAAHTDPPSVILRGDAAFIEPLVRHVGTRREARRHLLAGEALLRAGSPEQAMQEWEKALPLLPDERAAIDAYKDHHFAGARAATAAAPQPRIGDALRHVLAILRVDPDDPHALNVAGRIALSTGQFKDAVGFLERLRLVRPDTPDLELSLQAARQGAASR